MSRFWNRLPQSVLDQVPEEDLSSTASIAVGEDDPEEVTEETGD